MEEETKKNAVMLANDTLAASLAECYITVGDRRYNFMNAINVEATFTKTKSKVPILGQPGKGNKATGWEGTGKATFHYNTSIFRQMMLDYKNTGKDTYFDMTIANDDKDSAAGRQEIVLILQSLMQTESISMKIWTLHLRISVCRRHLMIWRDF